MKRAVRFSLLFLFAASAAAQGFASPGADALEEFMFRGQKYSLAAEFSPGRADLILQGPARVNLSAGMDGENILLGTVPGAGDVYIFWLNYSQSSLDLAVYGLAEGRGRLLGLPGFSFIGLPRIIEEDGGLSALVFLGNRSDNDDIFYFEPQSRLLLALTRTPYSEKDFSLREKDGKLEIETRSLRARYRYRFDRRLGKSELLEKNPFLTDVLPRGEAAGLGSDNTYIGFGDSITWGQIEGRQRLDLCFLTRLRALLEPVYGPWNVINLGIPAQTTLDGALRVDQDLAANPASYFLLMLGVNDVWRNTFSLASSLENLEYIVDAALARGLRVIISTLTPRKDRFSLYEFYWNQLRALSSGILDLARSKGIASIDTLAAFMGTHPPDGWKDLLENIIPDVSKGNHPNGEGHLLIASLFAAAWKANKLPLAEISVDKAEIYWRDPVNFSAAGSSDPDGAIVAYSWDFADGHVRSGKDVTYAFTSVGAVTVQLTVTDDLGATASATKVIQVKPRPFPVIRSDRDEIFWQDSVVFDGGRTLVLPGYTVRYRWDFGDGEAAEGIRVSHRFVNSSAYGDKQVTLTVVDNKNASASVSKTIKVNALYAAPSTFEKLRIRTLFYDRGAYRVSWTANAGNEAAGYAVVLYRIFRSPVSAPDELAAVADVDAAVRQYLDMGIDPALDYSYFVCAVDAQGHVSPFHHL